MKGPDPQRNGNLLREKGYDVDATNNNGNKGQAGVLEYAVKEKYSGPHDDKEGGRNCS